MRRDATANCALPLSPEAVAYIGGGLKWSVSRRPIRLGGVSEGLRTAQIALRSQPARRRVTYATAKPVSDTERRQAATAPRASDRQRPADTTSLERDIADEAP